MCFTVNASPVCAHCDSVSGGQYFGKVCLNTNVQCAVERLCSETVCAAKGWSCPAIGNILGSSFPSVQSKLKSRSDSPRALNSFETAALSCTFGDVRLGDIRVYYNTKFLNDLRFGSNEFSVGFKVEAQTFYNNIFMGPQYPTRSSDLYKNLGTIAHELQHVRQYHYLGGLTQFGKAYMEDMCDAGFSYDDNPFEMAAYKVENNFKSCYTGGRVACLSPGRRYLGMTWNSHLNLYASYLVDTCDDASTWEIAPPRCPGGIRHVHTGYYLGHTTRDGYGYWTLKTGCVDWKGGRFPDGRGGVWIANVGNGRCLNLSPSNPNFIWSGDSSMCLGWYGVVATTPRGTSHSSNRLSLAGSSSGGGRQFNWCSHGACKDVASGSASAQWSSFAKGNGGGSTGSGSSGGSKGSGSSTHPALAATLLVVLATLLVVCSATA